MKALVLCGGIPQKALIEKLKKRGIYTVLADMNPNVVARPYADAFFPVSVLDVDAVKKLAMSEKVDMILTACADQVLLVQAQVSKDLGLPCYIDYQTAQDVSNKELMKSVFIKNGIPTSKFTILSKFEEDKIRNLNYPLIVKPVDSYSSRGVRKVCNIDELKNAFENAYEISRTKSVIIEEYVEGEELTVDVYVEEGIAHTLCVSNIDKIRGNDRFVICRTRYPAQLTSKVKKKVEEVANLIAKAFHLVNSPMLIQMITNGDDISVVEFCARTGGGDKYRLIERVTGFDVIEALIGLTLGDKPHYNAHAYAEYLINEFIYVKPGVFDHLEGFEKAKNEGLIEEYFQLKSKGTICKEIQSSADRVAYYTIKGTNHEEVHDKIHKINTMIRAVDAVGSDILRHDIIESFA